MIFDSTIISRTNISDERDFKAPTFGLIYRYKVIPELYGEASLSISHDGETEEHSALIEVRGPTYHRVTVSSSNTTIATLGAGYNLPIRIFHLNSAVWATGGYAWRDVKFRAQEAEEELVSGFAIKADAMYLGRVGIDGSLWKSDNMIIEMSFYYTQFMPTDSDIDSFGGFGWRASVFPIWFGE